MISKTLGIEGKKLLTPEDDYEALKEFNHAYEGTKTAVEEMHLEYQALIQEDPELEARLKRLPGAIFSGRKRPAKGARGVSSATRYLRWTRRKASSPRRRAPRAGTSTISTATRSLKSRARSSPASAPSPRPPVSAPQSRRRWWRFGKVEKHIKNTYLKRVDAPVGVKPTLKCWMELNEG